MLFEIAYARFAYLNRFTTVTMPDPPEIMHWTYPVPVRMEGTRNVYTIHDLVPLKLPQTTLDNKSYHYRLVDRCIREADHICTVSESSRNDIISMFDVGPEKVTNTYQSSPVPAEILCGSQEDDFAIVRDLFGLKPRGFFLFFGAMDPKKNIDRIIEGYLTSRSALPLVIVSARDWGMKSETTVIGADGGLYGRKIDKQIVRLDYLPRSTLFRLARAAKAVLFPSLYEGFGLPALESIQLGTPVISSNVSALPEVVGDAGLLVDPYSAEAIAGAIRAIESDAELYTRLQAAAPAQAEQFSDYAYQGRLAGLYLKMGLGGAI